MARRLVTSSMTSRESMTTYAWRHNLQSRRTRKLGSESTIRVNSLGTHYRRIIVFKNQLIRLRTVGEKHSARPHFDQKSALSQCQQLPPLLCSVQRIIGPHRRRQISRVRKGSLSFESSDRCCGAVARYIHGDEWVTQSLAAREPIRLSAYLTPTYYSVLLVGRASYPGWTVWRPLLPYTYNSTIIDPKRHPFSRNGVVKKLNSKLL